MTNHSSGAKILVVEDEYSISEVCRKALTAEGYDVDLATDGQIALGMISNEHYDLILVDVRLPNMTGIELHRWLARESPEAACRLMFTTGDVLTDDTADYIVHSGRTCLPKPFTPSELRTRVEEELGIDKQPDTEQSS